MFDSCNKDVTPEILVMSNPIMLLLSKLLDDGSTASLDVVTTGDGIRSPVLVWTTSSVVALN